MAYHQIGWLLRYVEWPSLFWLFVHMYSRSAYCSSSGYIMISRRRQSTLYSLSASWFYMRRIQRRTKPQNTPRNLAGDWLICRSMVSYLFCLQSFSIRMTQPALRTLSVTRLRQHLRPLLRKRRVLLLNACLFPLLHVCDIIMTFTLLVVGSELCIWFPLFKSRSVGSTLRHACRKEVRSEVYFRLTKINKMYQRAYWNGWRRPKIDRGRDKQPRRRLRWWFFRSWVRRGDSSEFACH